MIEIDGEGKSAVATPDGKKPKEEEEELMMYMGRKCLSLLKIPTFRAIFLIDNQHVEPSSSAHLCRFLKI